MRRFALALAAAATFAALATPAVAADPYPTRDRAALDKLFVAASAYNWTGFYIGATVGYGFGSGSGSGTGQPFIDTNTSMKTSGTQIGVRGGYDYQFGQNWLLGGVLEYNLSTVKGSGSTTADFFGFPMTANFSARENWNLMLGGRAGYLLNPSLLVFGKAGFSWSNRTASGSIDFFGPFAQYESTKTLRGYKVGGGLEYKLTQNASATLEYDYARHSGEFTAERNWMPTMVIPTSFNDHAIRIGLNYKF